MQVNCSSKSLSSSITFILLMAQDKSRFSSFSWWNDATFPWRNWSPKTLVVLITSQIETVQKTKISGYRPTWSLKYTDQYLLKQFCSRRSVSFLQAVWNFFLKKWRRKKFLKFGCPRRDSNSGLWSDSQMSNPIDHEGLILSLHQKQLYIQNG